MVLQDGFTMLGARSTAPRRYRIYLDEGHARGQNPQAA